MPLIHANELRLRSGPRLPDWELWGCALTVERQYGSMWEAHVVARVEALATAGDWAGVATWIEIAARLGRLRAGQSVQ
jgi:hypothetical protein